VYQRQLLLHTNAAPKSLTLKLYTGSLSQLKPLPYVALVLLLLISGGLTWITLSGLISWLIAAEIPVITLLVAAVVGFLAIVIGTSIVATLLYWILGTVISELRGDANNSFRNSRLNNNLDGFIGGIGIVGVIIAFTIAGLIGADAYHTGGKHLIFPELFYSVLGLIGDFLPLLLVIVSLSLMYKNLSGRGFKKSLVYTLLILTVGFGSSIGIGFAAGYFSSTLLWALAGTGLPLAFLSLGPAIQQKRLVAKYRKSRELLTRP
jgi:hypothetical protein